MSRIHKAILASGSKYFLEVFHHIDNVTEADEEFKEILKPEEGKKPYVEVPKPVTTQPNQDKVNVSDENVNRILKFIYHN